MVTSPVILRQLQNSNLYASCPNCECDFKLSSAVIFDGLGKFPEIAESKRKEMFDGLKKRAEDLLQRKVQVDIRSERATIASGMGKIIEKVLPGYKEFNFPIADCRALFEPVDFIVFSGCVSNQVKQITFLDIKTGNARLNPHQRMIKDAVEKKRVVYEVV